MNLLYLWVVLMALFQSINGQISLTLLDDNLSPVTQETIEFMTEQEQVLGSCITNSNGHCVITLDNAPIDASGLIRGTLSIKERGKRPITWPGGQITIQLQLDDSGKLTVPSDLYVTRTPKATFGVQVEEVPEVTQTLVLASPTRRATPIIASASTPTIAATSTPKIAATNTPTGEVISVMDDKSSYSVWFQIALLVILIAAALVYVSGSKGTETS